MFSLKAQKREKFGRQTNKLRQAGILPAILYGEGIKQSIVLEVAQKDFLQAYQEAGTSSLIGLGIDNKEYPVLINDMSRDPLSSQINHVDFYKPSTKKEIVAEVGLVFEGQAPAEKDLGGTLIKEMQAIEVKGLVFNLPKEINVDVTNLKTFEDKILVKDIQMPDGVKALKDDQDVVALVVPPRREEIEEKEEKPEQDAEDKDKTEEEEGAEEKKE